MIPVHTSTSNKKPAVKRTWVRMKKAVIGLSEAEVVVIVG